MTDRVKTQLVLANEKIRELEAELAAERVVKEDVTEWWKEQQTRAEKAEAESLRKTTTISDLLARVAELRNEIWICHAVNEGRTHPLAERED